MKNLTFRNSSQLIHSILAGAALNDTSINLSFSTFRSEDYRCDYYLPYATDREGQWLQEELEDLTQSLVSEDSEEEESKEQSDTSESQPIKRKNICFRNKKETIERILTKKTGPSRKALSFRNSSSKTAKYLSFESKHN